MRSHHHRLIILKTALPDEVGYERLNRVAMSDKGGHRVVKICREVRPECLVRNAAMDVFAIADRQKPDNPSAGIICFAGGEFYTHDKFSSLEWLATPFFLESTDKTMARERTCVSTLWVILQATGRDVTEALSASCGPTTGDQGYNHNNYARRNGRDLQACHRPRTHSCR